MLVSIMVFVLLIKIVLKVHCFPSTCIDNELLPQSVFCGKYKT